MKWRYLRNNKNMICPGKLIMWTAMPNSDTVCI